MKIIIKSLVTVLVLTIWQCSTIYEDKTVFNVNLDNCKTQVNLKLSDLIDSCRFIQLETTSESIIDNNLNLFYITKNLILIGDRNGVYKFSGEGKFIKKLLKIGRGPDEIPGYCIFYYYEAKNLLLIDNQLAPNDYILCYDIQSECFLTPIKKCFPVSWSQFIVYEDSLLMGSIEIAGYLAQDRVPNPYALFIQNFKGEFISGIKSTKRLVYENFEELFQRMSIITGDKNVYVKNSHDDTIFYFKNNKVTPYIIPAFKNGSDIPKLIPDVGTKHVRLEKYVNKSFMIFNLSEFAGWKNINGFNKADYNYDFYLFNKSNGKYAQIDSFKDDLIGKETKIEKSMKQIPGAPTSSPNGLLYVLYFPHELINSDNQQNSAFPKNLISELDLIKGKINETDNPILLIGAPKTKLLMLE